MRLCQELLFTFHSWWQPSRQRMDQVSSPFTSKERHLSNSVRGVDRTVDGNWHYYKYVADRGIWFLLVSIPYQSEPKTSLKIRACEMQAVAELGSLCSPLSNSSFIRQTLFFYGCL